MCCIQIDPTSFTQDPKEYVKHVVQVSLFNEFLNLKPSKKQAKPSQSKPSQAPPHARARKCERAFSNPRQGAAGRDQRRRAPSLDATAVLSAALVAHDAGE
jgi:hypothetical protein